MTKRAFMLVAAIILMAAGSGCAAKIIVPPVAPETVTKSVFAPLPLPDRPVLPPLSAEDMNCLSDDAYRRLVARDRLRRQYAEDLETIIRATHQ